MFVKFSSGEVHSQDHLGRTHPENKHLRKYIDESKLGADDVCGCGSGEYYNKCCFGKPQEQRTTWKFRSIRERNMILIRVVGKILGFKTMDDWVNLKHRINDNTTKEIYGFLSTLWPVETDLYELLPKPDKTLRAVYTGVTDIELLPLIIGMVPYFDEIIIVSPFLNPNILNEEFNPILNPSPHKEQLLRDLSVLACLEPYIGAGKINLIPDPCHFDQDLNRRHLQIGKEKYDSVEVDQKDRDMIDPIMKQRITYPLMCTKEQIRQQIEKSTPEKSDGDKEKLSALIFERQQQDPTKLPPEESKDSQYMFFHMNPNFELTLLIAQVTGSIVVTSSHTRFGQLTSPRSTQDFINFWPNTTSSFHSTKLPAAIDPNNVFQWSASDKFLEFRKTFEELGNLMKYPPNITEEAIERIEANLPSQLSDICKSVTGDFQIKIEPWNIGYSITDINVQRLLLMSSCEHAIDYTPMICFLRAVEEVN